MRSTAALVVVLGLLPAPAAANDLAQALSFAQEIMGDDIIEGYEEFVDYDPTEALHLLLARDLHETNTPYEPMYEEGAQRPAKAPHFESLGRVRLTRDTLLPYIQRAAEQTGLPAALIDAVIRTESGYRPQAVSRAGARGLMQLMPATAREVGVHDPFDPAQNILGGARYLRKMYDRFGTLRQAIAAYNAGPGAVARHGGVPPFRETRRYVRAVLERFEASGLR